MTMIQISQPVIVKAPEGCNWPAPWCAINNGPGVHGTDLYVLTSHPEGAMALGGLFSVVGFGDSPESALMNLENALHNAQEQAAEPDAGPLATEPVGKADDKPVGPASDVKGFGQ